MSDDDRCYADMAKTLGENGYLVIKVPDCGRKERGHGRHVLMTRSAVCEGREPMPHGYVNTHFGTFGPWVSCSCGHEFRDYASEDEERSPWEQHKVDTGQS